MFDSIFSTFWGDSASYISSIDTIVPESLTTLIAVLLRNSVNGVTIFNIQILLATIVTFLGSYYIGNKIFKNKLSALFLATILTFAPIRIRYSMEWAVLAYWGYYVIFLYSIFDYVKSNSLKSLILAGITFGLGFTEQPYIGVILTIVTGISLTVFLVISKNKEYLKRSLILCGVLILFGIPGIYNVYKQRYINEIYNDVSFSAGTRSESNRWAYSARPWNYLIPDINNPFLGDISVKANYWIWDHPPYYLTEPFFPKEHTLYLGFTLITLSALTIYLTFIKKLEFFKDYKDLTIFLIIIVVVSFIFSMPPYITYNGFYFYFPGQLMYEFLPQFRAYARFGALVFIGVALLATIFITYILKKELKAKIPLIVLISLLVFVEFATPFFFNKISEKPTAPYVWLSQQDGDFSYLEIPRRIDYTDGIYQKYHKKRILNAYLKTPESIAEIERSITQNIGDSKELICTKLISDLKGKYIIYHDKEIYKTKLVNEFTATGEVTPGLKIAIEESWGEPVWGNHVPKSEEDLIKIAARNNLLSRLANDNRFTLVKQFRRGDLDNDKNYNANDLDEVTIFELNPDYCK